MANDARLNTNILQHPKIKKLNRKFGPQGPLSFIALILWVAGNRPDGDLMGMDADDIEMAIDWPLVPGELFGTLLNLRLVDEVTPNHYVIHDWEEHNPWVAGSEDRSERARYNALIKHHGVEYARMQMPDFAKKYQKKDGGKTSSEPSPDIAKSSAARNASSKDNPATSMRAAGENDASGMHDASVQHASSMQGAVHDACATDAARMLDAMHTACDAYADSNAGCMLTASEQHAVRNAPSPSPSPSPSTEAYVKDHDSTTDCDPPQTEAHTSGEQSQAKSKPSAAPRKRATTAPSGETWAAYSDAYTKRYGVAPIRNATVSGQLANFVKRIGQVEAPSVAEFYVLHPGQFYVRAMHSIAMMVRDAEKLRTEWATGQMQTERGHGKNQRHSDTPRGTPAERVRANYPDVFGEGADDEFGRLIDVTPTHGGHLG